jgi:hypothetical protein
MKLFLLLAALALSAPTGLTGPTADALADRRRGDDPPPEPIDCPFCGGNASLHAARIFAIAEVGGVMAVRVLRW